jgi:hypothetical protein
MSAMLGRSGAWFYGRPCGETSRIMRRSGRQRERLMAAAEAWEETHPDVEAEAGFECGESYLDRLAWRWAYDR